MNNLTMVRYKHLKTSINSLQGLIKSNDLLLAIELSLK